MTTIGPISIAVNNDDGEVDTNAPGTLYQSGEGSGILYIGRWTSNTVYGFFRFQLPSAIPSGSVINSGTKIALYGVNTTYWSTSYALEAYGQQSSDAPQQSNATIPTFTTASVRWPAVGGLTWVATAYNELDITTIIQELVTDYGGLASGAYIQIWIRGYNEGGFTSYEVSVEDYAHAYDNLAQLTIDYTAPTIEQEGFRFRNDDGSESTATWNGNQDTNITLAADTAFRLREILNATHDPSSIGAQLECRHKPSGGAFGSWYKVN